MRDDGAWTRVAAVGDIPPGSSRAFRVGRFEIAVFNVDGAFYALENTCPHQGGPIAEGWMEGPLVTCPWHAWCFDVRTGKMTLGEYARVARFNVHVANGAVYVNGEPCDES